MWNPDAVLRVEDIKHKENTQERLDKAAATQMVFEDALMHLVRAFYQRNRHSPAGAHRWNRRSMPWAICESSSTFDENFFRREPGGNTRLHLWVPPVPNDAGVTIGAAYMGAYHAGYGVGAPIEHAFYCGASPTEHDIRAALTASPDIEWTELKSAASPDARGQFADFMAFMTAHDAIFALYQGAAETGPRALAIVPFSPTRAIRRRGKISTRASNTAKPSVRWRR